VWECVVVKQLPSSFVAKVRDEVFAHFNAVVEKVTAVCGIVWPVRTSSIHIIPFMSKKMMSILLNLLFTSLAFFCAGEFPLFHSHTRLRLRLSSPNAYVIIARVSIALFVRFTENLMPARCQIYREIPSYQIHGSTYEDVRTRHMYAVA
jgi:hypothetical protein